MRALGRPARLALVFLLSLAPLVAQADTDRPSPLVWSWDWDVVFLLVLGAAFYLGGCLRLATEGQFQRVLGWGRVAWMAAGYLVLVIALDSPLDALADDLFSAHMSQHMLLLLVVPPFLVLGRPGLTSFWALPLAWRRGLGRWWARGGPFRKLCQFLAKPTVVWCYASVVLWVWHAPGAYDLAYRNENVHTFEHLSYVVTALAFWSLVLAPGSPRRSDHAVGLAALTTFSLHMGLLGAIITFANHPYYMQGDTLAYGLTRLEDQQLAGLIMWIPSGLVHLSSLVMLLYAWLSAAEQRAHLRDLERRASALT